MAPLLRQELSWFVLGLLIAILIGLIAGDLLFVPLLFTVCFSVWMLIRVSAIVAWLEDGAPRKKAPPSLGLTDQIIGLVHREKKYSRKQKNRYRTALAQFNSLAAELPDATILLDEYRQIRWSNNAARMLLNIHPERDRAQRIDNLVRDPEFQEFLLNSDASEIELTSAVGRNLTLLVRKVPTGKGMTVLIASDITQRVKVREMRKAFVGDVSHELRTPLTVIMGYLEVLRGDTALPDKTLEALEQVSVHSTRMQHIVDHLLELSKLEGSHLAENEGDSLPVAELIKTLVHGLKDTVGQHHIFEMSLNEELALRGSESEIYSACHNLITNAVNYTPPGTKITIDWMLDELNQPTLAVIDEGAGIEARHLPRLSERFYRVDKGRSRVSGGTGLGLAIVKHATQRHGGELQIDSSPGQGSHFTIVFPASRAINLRSASNF
jgi:two-component system phosphate regulon sensor histidine kinase PhoR